MKFLSLLLLCFSSIFTNGYNNFTDTCNSSITVKTEDLTDGGACVRGDYIAFGNDKTLVFGTKSNPTTFTSESSKGVGLQLDHDCWDMNEDSEHGDFFLPGSEEESYTVGYSLTYAESFSESSLPSDFTNKYCSRMGSCNFVSYVDAQSWSNTNQVGITGKVYGDKLNISQNSYLDFNGEEIKVDVTLCNKGDTDIHNVYYLRSFDPDVDADKHSQYTTTNEVIAQKTQGYKGMCYKNNSTIV